MGREHESEVSVCPLHHAAARSSGENFSSVKHRQTVTTSGMSRSEQTGLMGRFRQALRSALAEITLDASSSNGKRHCEARPDKTQENGEGGAVLHWQDFPECAPADGNRPGVGTPR